MKRSVSLLVVLCLSFFMLYAQDGKTHYYELDGGNIQYEMILYNTLLFGIGSKSMMTNSTLKNYGVESIYWNPAGLGFLKKGEIFIDYAPPVFISPTRFIDLQDNVDEAVDDEFKDKMIGGAPYIYPDLNAEFSSGTRFQSFGFALPVKQFTFGAAYYNQFELKLNMFSSGVGIHMKDYEDIGVSDTTSMRLSLNFGANLNFYSEAISFAFAYQPLEQLAIGLTVENYNVSAVANGNINKNGWMYRSSYDKVYYFNDPSQGYYNSLLDTLKGSFHGNSMAIRLGSSYRFNQQSELAFTLYIPFTVKMTGNLYISNTTPVFYSGGEIDEDKILENLDQRTKTKQVKYYSRGMDIRIPGNVKLGYTYAFSGVSFIFNAGYSFNEFSYHYANYEVDKTKSKRILREYHQGIKPGADLRLGIDFGTIKLGTGVIFCKHIKDYKEEGSIPIPLFSIAFGFPVGEHLKINGHLLSLTLPLSRVSLTYSF